METSLIQAPTRPIMPSGRDVSSWTDKVDALSTCLSLFDHGLDHSGWLKMCFCWESSSPCYGDSALLTEQRQCIDKSFGPQYKSEEGASMKHAQEDLRRTHYQHTTRPRRDCIYPCRRVKKQMRQPRAKYLELSQRLLFSDDIIHIKIAKN